MTQEHWGPGQPAEGGSPGGPAGTGGTAGDPPGEPTGLGGSSAYAGVGASATGPTDGDGGTGGPGGPGGTGGPGAAAGRPGGRPGGKGGGGKGAGGMWASRSGADADGTEGGEGPERLERSRQNKVVAGVCGGLGRHFDTDPVLFRVPLAVLSVMGGLGLLFYAFAWLLVPLEGEDENEARRLLSGRVEGGALAAVLCALAGCGVVLASLDNSRLLTFALMLCAAVGAAAYWSQRTRGQKPDISPELRPEAPPEPQAPPAPVAPSWWREPTHEGYLWGPEGADFAPSGEWIDPATGGHEPVAQAPVPEPWRLSLGGGVYLAALGTAITASAVVWSSQPLGTALVIGLSAALAVFGLGLAVGAFRGRIGGGAIVGVVLTTVLIAVAAALPQDLTTTFSEQVWRPTNTTEVRDHYRMGSGQGTLDLGGLKLKEDETVRTSVRVAAGEAQVVVPPDAQVEVDLRLGLGGYDLPGVGSGKDQGGVSGGGFRVTESYTMSPIDGEKPTGTIELTIDVGMGGVQVERDLEANVDAEVDANVDAEVDKALSTGTGTGTGGILPWQRDTAAVDAHLERYAATHTKTYAGTYAGTHAETGARS